MTTVVRFEKRGKIGAIIVNNPPVNALSHPVRVSLKQAIESAWEDDGVEAILLVCGGKTFFAGADIREFGKPMQEPWLDEIISALESSPKPTVAAIHGTALGGGLETALGCHYRCAVESAKVGQPEVRLGFPTSAGATQRLPRLAGFQIALEMVATGSPIDAKKAHQVGIIDHLIEGNLIEGAEAYVNRLISEGAGPRPAKDIPIDSNAVPEDLFKEFRKKIEKRTRGYFAPERCVQALEAAVDLPFEEGLKKESQLFMECITHPQAAALQHLFFAEREASKVPDVTRETPIREIKKIGVIGCGTMGSGISMACSNAGFPVTVVETDNRTLEKGLSNIKKSYESSVKKGRITADQAVERVSRIQGVLDFEELGNADLVIEAVYEDLKLKKEIFHRLDTICKQGTILATNTSTLDVDEISQCTNRPADVIGLHFFSPAHVMRLLEIVRGNQTAADVLATSTRLAKAIGKVGVVSGVCFGFIGNRMLFGYAREAHVLLLEGATPQQVDQAIYEFGFPMGPFTMMDLAGIDIGYRIRQEIGASPGEEQFSLISDRLAEMGRFGQKTGAGFYLYEPGSRKPLPDPEVQSLIEEEARLLGFKRRAMADSEIVKRCIYPLVNEGARILEEGIALRPGDIDVVWTTGYGFPPYRGGPMHYADSIGLAKIYEEICGFRNSCGEHWRPAPLLRALAEEEKPFSDRR